MRPYKAILRDIFKFYDFSCFANGTANTERERESEVVFGFYFPT